MASSSALACKKSEKTCFGIFMGPSYFFTGCKVSESWKPDGLALLELATVGHYNKHLGALRHAVWYTIIILSQGMCNSSIWSPCPLLCHHIPLVIHDFPAPVLAKLPRSCPPLIENVLPVVPAHHATGQGHGQLMGNHFAHMRRTWVQCGAPYKVKLVYE